MYFSVSSSSIVGRNFSTARNNADGEMLPARFGRRTNLLNSLNTVVLPQPFVGETTASRGEIVNALTIHVCRIHRVIASAAASDSTA
jgi:hypothetical protein